MSDHNLVLFLGSLLLRCVMETVRLNKVIIAGTAIQSVVDVFVVITMFLPATPLWAIAVKTSEKHNWWEIVTEPSSITCISHYHCGLVLSCLQLLNYVIFSWQIYKGSHDKRAKMLERGLARLRWKFFLLIFPNYIIEESPELGNRIFH